LISDFQSEDRGLRLAVRNLPWPTDTAVSVRRWQIDAKHRLALMQAGRRTGRDLVRQRPWQADMICLIALRR
jgi:hypothetical protein